MIDVQQPIPRFVITLRNRACGDDMVARYEAHQVPSKGDLVHANDRVLTERTPFKSVSTWRVDTVAWQVSGAGSHNSVQWAIHRGLQPGTGCCFQVDLFVWPEEGPYWYERPSWAWKDPDEPEEEDVTKPGQV